VAALTHTNEILEALSFPERWHSVSQDDGLSRSAARKVRILSEAGIDQVHFSGDFPSIYFKSVSSFDDETLFQVCEIHKKIWNERKASFFYVTSPTELRIYNCFAEPVNPNRLHDLEKIQLYSYNITEDERKLEKLIQVFSRVSIDSGMFWNDTDISDKLNSDKRVDKALMRNLKEIRSELQAGGLKIDIIHDLLLRSLFVLYLEDRKATTKEFYAKYLKGSESYFDILEDLEATYTLFEKLEVSFNGNLCPVSAGERRNVKAKHLKLIKECFWSHEHQSKGYVQLFNWKIFDFSVIRIELISEIYEEFLSTERGEDDTRKKGAYYTPHSLVDFILNEKLPWADNNNQNYTMKVLDPTCGSGIFLVESYKRIVDRWKYSNQTEEIDFETLKKLLLDSVYGIEINPDAIKVTAFSLYLAMLDYLNPRTLWQNKRFPYLIYDSEMEDTRRGKNLFRMSSLETGPFEKLRFDLVVGNPPFKRGNLEDSHKDYLNELGFAQEYVIAFLYRVTQLCPEGQIALVSTSKILFNTSTGYQRFRDFLFNQNYVEAIFNFSALRKTKKEHGGNLFASAVGPACVIFYQKRTPVQGHNKILYCSPRSILKSRLVDGIALDVSDIKYIPRKEASKPTSKIWKIAMWGSERDSILIERLSSLPLLKERFKKAKKDGWAMGVGFETSEPADKSDNTIKKLPHIEASNIERFYSRKDRTTSITRTMFYRLGEREAFKAPHVLIKEGQSNRRFCASYLNYDCSFKKTVFGISSKDTTILKALTAYLNSSFSSYFLFLTASSWGVERERVQPNEIADLPALPFIASKECNLLLAKKVDEIIAIKNKKIFTVDGELTSIEQEIDDIIFKSLSISPIERTYINDVLDFSLDLFQEGESSEAYKPASTKCLDKYAKQLCNSLDDFLKDSTLTPSVRIYDMPHRSPLRLIALSLSTIGISKEQVLRVDNSTVVRDLLRTIDNYSYEKHSESVYFRKTIKYFDGDTIYLIKPNEMRFWSKSSAANDANELTFEILNTPA
jgi:type I restriction-modification system DNA methylase subunit